MTRVKVSLWILSFLLIFSISSGIWVNLRCRDLLELSSSISLCIEDGDYDSAHDYAEKLTQTWESFRSIADIIVKNDRLSDISRVCSRLVPILEAGSDELNAELDELTELIKLLKSSELPIITSIF